MTRSSKKGIYINKTILDLLNKDNNFIKTKDRNTVILPEMVGKTILLHNGRKYCKVYISDEMIGHRLGEFVFTRTYKKQSNKTSQMKKPVKTKK